MHHPRRAMFAALALGLGVIWAAALRPPTAVAQTTETTPPAEVAPQPEASPRPDPAVAPAETPGPAVEPPGEPPLRTAGGRSSGQASEADGAVPEQAVAAETAAAEASAEAAPGEAQPAETPTMIELARWVVASGDSGGQPFVIIDKVAAVVSVFAPDGALQGSAPVLLGLARGDDSAPDIGERKLSAISPEERTTPAGRFVSGFGWGAGGRKVLWIDYASSLSLHPVVTSNPREHRLERIRSASPDDRRISFGCINVPARFYHGVVLPTLKGTNAVFYILPETRPLEEVFPSFAYQGRAGAARSALARTRSAQEGPVATQANATAAAPDAAQPEMQAAQNEPPATPASAPGPEDAGPR